MERNYVRGIIRPRKIFSSQRDRNKYEVVHRELKINSIYSLQNNYITVWARIRKHNISKLICTEQRYV